MAPGGYLAVWGPPTELARPELAQVEALARSQGGRRVHGLGGLWLIVFGRGGGVRRAGDADVLIGDVFEAPPSFVAAPERLQALAGDAPARAGRLLERVWGAYVAFLRTQDGWAVLRDPSGGREAIAWRAGGLHLVASSLHLPLGPLAPNVAIDWEALGACVADAVQVSSDLALSGVKAVAPGSLLRTDGVQVSLWTPAGVVRRGPGDPAAAAAQLGDTVAGCIMAWASTVEAPIVEVSGGLDSAIVTAAIGPGARGRAAAFVNHVVEEAGADERTFALQVAALWSVPLLEVAQPESAFEPAALFEAADAIRPAFNGSDAQYDRGVVALAAERGADAVVTGQAGDAVLLTLRSPWTAADLLGRRGLGGLADPELGALARRLQTSLWSVWGHALLGWAGLGRPAPRPFNLFASKAARDRARGRPAHPWLADLDGLTPARHLQIEGLADALNLQGDCLRARTVRLLHPLFSQPVLELCLRIGPDLLTCGGRDRGLARDAFADRLPPAVFRRRTKGDMTAYYGRRLARGGSVLETFLLGGRLAKAGLLDLDALAGALNPERLAADGGYGDLMDLATLEAWTRRWASAQGRPPA